MTTLSLSDIRQRVAAGVPVVTWDSDDNALDDDLEACHARIRADIARLRASGCELRFQYRPAPDDEAEAVTYDEILNLMESDIEYDSQEHD